MSRILIVYNPTAGPVPVQADGDALGTSPLIVSDAPAPIDLIVNSLG